MSTFGLNVFARKLFARRCPMCGSIEVHRSERRRGEWIKMALALRPYRCWDCNFRFLGLALRRVRVPPSPSS
jgi:predicted RNA-binding Zn-ribbon protein involved in translation (DUF1610 family)